ncbi:hypothetical protein [Streptosporangium carneum]|uniref:Secreted protein n=1 Tax=Streptosporangium carneum TaxID=47481 RepID=A0A9W6MCX9_9ACTN|nr:hypothetical protein [Streptosporangium carneum]GLK09924.1 hypothetical protein GCM10017600_33300 [Streptosporangium carneum]
MLRRIAAVLAAATLSATALAVTVPAQAASAQVADRAYTETRIAGFHAAPNPARRHQHISLQGQLQVGEDCNPHERGSGLATRHNPCGDSRTQWTGSAGWQKIVVLFRAGGRSKWEFVDTIETGRDGRFFTKVPVYTSGTWRVVFEGARGLSPSEDSDWVKVFR